MPSITSFNIAHLHLLLNHAPTVGAVVALGLCSSPSCGATSRSLAGWKSSRSRPDASGLHEVGAPEAQEPAGIPMML
jgi:hypothetical protein